jgi:hypothetical protein
VIGSNASKAVACATLIITRAGRCRWSEPCDWDYALGLTIDRAEDSVGGIEPMTLITTFFIAFGKAAGMRAGAETVTVVRELIGLQSAQTQMLTQMDVKIDALLQRPYEVGDRQLQRALDEWREPTDREEFLKLARTSFMEAQSHPSPVARSLAGLHLAVVWAALNSPRDVRASLEEAQLEALRAVERERRQTETGLRKLLGPSEVQGLVGPGPRVLIALANLVAIARREWGEPTLAAPVFVGFALPERPDPQLTPLEQVRWQLLTRGGWGLSVGGVDYSRTPAEQREAASDEVVAWIQDIEKGEREGSVLYHGHIGAWLEKWKGPGPYERGGTPR